MSETAIQKALETLNREKGELAAEVERLLAANERAIIVRDAEIERLRAERNILDALRLAAEKECDELRKILDDVLSVLEEYAPIYVVRKREEMRVIPGTNIPNAETPSY